MEAPQDTADSTLYSGIISAREIMDSNLKRDVTRTGFQQNQDVKRVQKAKADAQRATQRAYYPSLRQPKKHASGLYALKNPVQNRQKQSVGIP
jgi:hypothetical protein